MRLPLWLSLLTATVSVTACKGNVPNSPPVSICVFRAEDSKFYCSKPDGTAFILNAADADKYVAMSAQDSQASEDFLISIETQLNTCEANQ